MKLDDNIVDNNEEQYIPIRARGNTIVGYVPLRFLLSDDFDAKLICNYINMNDKEEIYSKLNKLYDFSIRSISVDLPAKDLCRPPEAIKKDIKHEKKSHET